jgi:hypothetical protein
VLDYTCNICASRNRRARSELTREGASCSACGSSVRIRSLMRVLSLELFGTVVPLAHLPRIKSLRGLGMSDTHSYAEHLSRNFDYRNTFWGHPPHLDITSPGPEHRGQYDFIVSSEILEHVSPPVEQAFRNLRDMLTDTGVLVMTVPYSIEDKMTEHYPDLYEYGFVRLGETTALVNSTRTGEVQVFRDPVFHQEGAQNALEMREFTEKDLKRIINAAGFIEVRIHAEDDPDFGVIHQETWSLPITARKGPAALRPKVTRELLEEWRDLNGKFQGEMTRLNRSLWFRLGRKLGLL